MPPSRRGGGQQVKTMNRFHRRSLLTGAAGLLAGGFVEWLGLRGDFDHRDSVPRPRDARARYLKSIDALAAGDDAIVHVGHSTHLLSLGGARVLTDPWFYDPAHGGMRHTRGPAVRAEDAGPLDLIAITHEHPDHLDPMALDRLDKRALCVLPSATLAARVRALGFDQVEHLAPYRSLEHAGVRVTAVPALHDVHEVGYVLEHDAARVYFAGDTAVHGDLQVIAERFTPTAAILPVDGTRLRGDRRWVMDPAEAADAARVLGAALVMPSHADARFTAPVLRLWAEVIDGAAGDFAARVAQLPGVRCAVPAPGERVKLNPA